MLKIKKATAKAVLANPRAYREKLDLNQKDFWLMFGCTQSGGSRYENGRAMPNSLKALLVVHAHEGGDIISEALAVIRSK